MALKYIECVGSEYPMGVLQGRLLKDSVAEAWQTIQHSPEMEHIRPKLVPKALHLVHAQKKAVTFLKNYIANFMNHQSERVLGIANGADISQEAIYFLQAYEMELQTKLDTYAISSGSALAVLPEKASFEEPLLAKNLDMGLELGDHIVVRKSKPRQGYASLEITHPFMAGTYCGMNEHGLAIVHSPCYTTDMLSLKTIPLAMLIQEALQNCRTTRDAISVLSEKHHRDVGGNLIIMDSAMDLKVLELTRTKHASYQPDSGYVAITNHFKTTELAGNQLGIDSTFTNKAMSAFAGQSVYQSSKSRLDRLNQVLSQPKALFDVDAIKNILTDRTGNSEDAICRHGKSLVTQMSVIMCPAKRTMYVASGQHCTFEYSTYTLTV